MDRTVIYSEAALRDLQQITAFIAMDRRMDCAVIYSETALTGLSKSQHSSPRIMLKLRKDLRIGWLT